MFFHCRLKLSHLVSSISAMSLAVGLVIAEPTTQKSLAQEAPTQINGGSLIQEPLVPDAIAVTYNPQGLRLPPGGLRLSRETYCGIFTGNIRNFSHPRFQLDTTFPSAINLQLTVVRRSDSSGSTLLLSQHLKAVCAGTAYPWNRGVGTVSVAGDPPPNPAPNVVYWPNNFLSVSGSSGVARTVAKNPGVIGYLEDSVRLAAFLPAAPLENQAGYFVGPSPTAITAAFTDASDSNAYPIPAVREVLDTYANTDSN